MTSFCCAPAQADDVSAPTCEFSDSALARHSDLHAELARTGPHLKDIAGVLVGVDAGLMPSLAWKLANGRYAHDGVGLVRDHVNASDRAVCIGAGLGVAACALAQQTRLPVPCVDQDRTAGDRVHLAAELNNVKLPFIHGHIGGGAPAGRGPLVAVGRLCAEQGANVVYLDVDGSEQLAFLPGFLPPVVTKLIVVVHRPDAGGKRAARVLNDIYSLGFRMAGCRGFAHAFVR